jgi:adenylate kinase family enzyme
MNKEKVFIILAGANGVGKTTLSKEILKNINIQNF